LILLSDQFCSMLTEFIPDKPHLWRVKEEVIECLRQVPSFKHCLATLPGRPPIVRVSADPEAAAALFQQAFTAHPKRHEFPEGASSADLVWEVYTPAPLPQLQ
jgi:hypothetical protein